MYNNDYKNLASSMSQQSSRSCRQFDDHHDGILEISLHSFSSTLDGDLRLKTDSFKFAPLSSSGLISRRPAFTFAARRFPFRLAPALFCSSRNFFAWGGKCFVSKYTSYGTKKLPSLSLGGVLKPFLFIHKFWMILSSHWSHSCWFGQKLVVKSQDLLSWLW